MIKAFLNKPFPYLDKLYYRLLLVSIMAVYTVFFLVAFHPFNFDKWLTTGWLGLALMGILAAIPFLISQILVRSLVKIKKFKVKHLIIWFLFELVLLTLFMAVLYNDPDYDFFEDITSTFKYTILLILPPYSFALLVVVLLQIVKQKDKTQYLSNNKIDLISFKDEKGQVKFSVRSSDLLYIESMDNYVIIFFLDDSGNVNKHILRTSLKNIEEEKYSPNLLRSHRSYIVNLENVTWMKKEGRKYVLKLKNIDPFIPVSRSFIPQFELLLYRSPNFIPK